MRAFNSNEYEQQFVNKPYSSWYFVSLTLTQLLVNSIKSDLKKQFVPTPKENSVVEVIGGYYDSGLIPVRLSKLLVNDSGTLKILYIEKDSGLDTMSPLPKYLIKSWIGERASYTRILAELKRPTYDSSYESYESYDEPVN
jgi:hypothetical protein